MSGNEDNLNHDPSGNYLKSLLNVHDWDWDYSLIYTWIFYCCLLLIASIDLFSECVLLKTMEFFSCCSHSVQLVGCIATSLSTTKVYSHNLVWLHKIRSFSPSLSPSQFIPTGQTSFKQYYPPRLLNIHWNKTMILIWWGFFFLAAWLPWLWKTAKLAASRSVRSIALWRNIFLISRYDINIT